MIEEGLTLALKEALEAEGINVPGGFFAAQLPKDTPSAAAPSAWAYRFFGLNSGETLKGQNSWTETMLQLDCHGWDEDGGGAPRAILLAKQIEVAMRTIGPTRLPDADQTFVDSVHLEDQNDGFNDASRSYVRSLDYLIQYHRQ